MKNIKSQSIYVNAFYSFMKAFMTLIFPLITFPYASRILLSSGIGTVDYSNSIISYFIILAELGIGKYAVREVAKRKNNPEDLSIFVKEMLLLNFISTIIAYGLFFCSIFFIHKLNIYKSLLLLSSIKIVFMTLGVEWFYTGIEEFKYITIRSFIVQVLSLIYLFIFVKTPDNLYEYAFFTIFSAVGSNLFNFIHLRKYIRLFDKQSLQPFKHIRYIFTFFGMSLISSLYCVLDKSMLGFLSNTNEVGYYSAAQKMNNLVIGLVISIGAVFLPRLAVYFKEAEKEKFNLLASEGINIITLLSIPMTVGLFLLAEPVILLICGKDFIPAVSTMKILVFVIFIISITTLIGSQILPAFNKEKYSMLSYGCAALSNIICNFIFIPKYGALGAAFATLIAESVEFIILIICLKKIIFSKIVLINFIESCIASFIMGIGVFFIIKLVSFNIILQLIIGVIFGIVIYALILIVVRNNSFLSFLKKILKR